MHGSRKEIEIDGKGETGRQQHAIYDSAASERGTSNHPSTTTHSKRFEICVVAVLILRDIITLIGVWSHHVPPC
jgi:hypothetical protein